MASGNSSQKSSAFRCADIGHLPKRMLSPIEGYENLPIVSLEEAVEPLINIVPKLKRNIYLVKQNCQEPKDGLTIDESASIMLYTFESIPHEDSLYVKLNATLRSEERSKLIPWFSYLRLLFTALARLPSESRAVFRGVREHLWDEYPKGKTFIWWGFSSCTRSVEVLENEQFLGKYGDRTLFQIECKSAKNIKNHSWIPNEEEVLLLPARQFEVVSLLDSGNGLHMVQLKEVKPPFNLLEPVKVNKVSVDHNKTSHSKSHSTTKWTPDQNYAVQQTPHFNPASQTIPPPYIQDQFSPTHFAPYSQMSVPSGKHVDNARNYDMIRQDNGNFGVNPGVNQYQDYPHYGKSLGYYK